MNLNRRARFKRSFKRIEIIITYACNMKCFNCDAMVRQAPSAETMDLSQIDKFILESIEAKINWESIRILGGEPTTHPKILEIFERLIEYKKNYSPETNITLVTNGYGKFVRNKIKVIEEKFDDVIVENSNKSSNEQLHFSPINQAPVDLLKYKEKDLTKGCWITSICGIALSMHGYYPCTTAASIDRVFGLDVGRKELPCDDDLMEDLFEHFCKLCGHYYHEINDLVDFDINKDEDYIKLEKLINDNQRKIEEKRAIENKGIDYSTSPTWNSALDKWRDRKIKLTSY